MRIILLLLFSWGLMFSCQNNSSNATSTSSAAAGLEGDYQFEDIPSSDATIASRYNPEGALLESGIMRNGMKNGTWTYYGAETDFPLKVISFVENQYNGAYMEFNDRGQAELMATYKNNMLHGPWGKFRFGRPEMTANYVDGELDGVLREYDFRNGKLKKEASYKAGQLDGLVRDYDEEGQVMVEYMYRDGEKISGGAIERE